MKKIAVLIFLISLMFSIVVVAIQDEITIEGYSLTLEGNIGVKVYAELSENIQADSISATAEYKGESYTLKLTSAGDNLYYVKFYVVAKEMNEDIVFQIGDETLTVSVKDYVDIINSDKETYADDLDVVNAMFDYGEYARKYFVGGEISPSIDVSVTDVEISDVHRPSKIGELEGINIYSSSLILDANTTIRHYFKVSEGHSISDYTFTLDGAISLTPVKKGNYYCVDIEGIPAHRIDTLSKVTVSKGEESVIIGFSPLSYAKTVLERNSANDYDLINLLKSFYNYSCKSEVYYSLNMEHDTTSDLITITAPLENETVYPFIDQVKRYLKDTEKYIGQSDIDISVWPSIYQYAPTTAPRIENPYKSVDIVWTSECENVKSYTVVYATKADFSDEKVVSADKDATSVSLYNLYKATKYYVKVIANLDDGSYVSTSSSFTIADSGARAINLDGIYNMRDMGGYMTSSGKRTLQGLLYRSGQLNETFGEYSTQLTNAGKYSASEELGIKVDFDFRYLNDTPIPDATCIHVPLSSYNLGNANGRDDLRQAFSILSNINYYPMVYHCQGGADRTGTLSYLLLAMLGVDEAEVIRDYEFTSFSIYLWRNITNKSYIAKEDYKFFETLDSQEGDTLEERVVNYLLSIGVTQQEMDNIKSIMFTGTAPRSVTFPTEYSITSGEDLNITVNGSLDDISGVYIDSNKVDWTKIAGGISIALEDFYYVIESGEVELKICYEDGEEIAGSFTYDGTKSITVPEKASRIFGYPLDITLNALPEELGKVYVGGYEVEYTLKDRTISVDFDDVNKAVKNGEVEVKVVLTDLTEFTDTVDYDGSEVVDLADYMNVTTLHSANTSVVSSEIGYGKWIRMHMEAVNKTHGDIRVFVGSYGMRLRGGSPRYTHLTSDGDWEENELISGIYSLAQKQVEAGNVVYFDIKVDLVDETTVSVSVALTNRDTGRVVHKGFTRTYTRLTSGEIASPYVTIAIDGQDSSELIVYGKDVDRSITLPETFKLSESGELEIMVNGNVNGISKAYLNSTEVAWTRISGGLSVDIGEFYDLVTTGDSVQVKVVFEDGEEVEGSFVYDGTRSIDACDEVSHAFNYPLEITLNTLPNQLSKVYVGEYEVDYTLNDRTVTVALESMPSQLNSGEVTVKVVLTDSVELTDTFKYDNAQVVYLSDYTDTTTLIASNSSLTTDEVGYGKWIRVHMEAVNTTYGDIRVYVGSYGMRLRSGSPRYTYLTSDGTWRESGLVSGIFSLAQKQVEAGNKVYFNIKVDLIDETTVAVSLALTNRETGAVVHKGFTNTYTRLTSGEITSPYVTIAIDGQDTTELVLHGKDVDRTLNLPEEFSLGDSTTLSVTINGNANGLSEVYMNGESVEWNDIPGGFSVVSSAFPSGLGSGEVTLKAVFEDGEEVTDTFIYDDSRSIISSETVSEVSSLPLEITLNAPIEQLSKVYVGGFEVEYTLTDNVISVAYSEIDSTIESGEVTVKVVLSDGAELTDTFVYDGPVVYVSDYMEETTLSGETLTASTESDIGYGKWARIHMEAVNDANGRIYVFVGSYGVFFRGGSPRSATLTASGTAKYITTITGVYNLAQKQFEAGNLVYLNIKVDLVDDKTAKVSLALTRRDTGKLVNSCSYNVTRLTSDEMTTAPVTFKIDGVATSQLTIFGD